MNKNFATDFFYLLSIAFNAKIPKRKTGGEKVLVPYALDKNIENELVTLAKKHRLNKLILFGSRAKNTNHEKSDIDIAVKGGDIINFIFDVKEQVNTLLLFDIISLDENISENLAEEIKKGGIILYEEKNRPEKKNDAFLRSLSILLGVDLKKSFEDEIYRMGIIGQFHLTFELAWKALREVLLFHGVNEAEIGSPREIIKLGYRFNFLSDEKTWLEH